MNAREQAASKHGAIKLLPIPQEVALIICCLDWVKLDLQMAVEDLKRIKESSLPVNTVKQQIPQGAFTALLSLIEGTQNSILEHSIAHYEEICDSAGKAALKETIDKYEKMTFNIQQYRSLLFMKAYREAPS